MQTGTQYAGLRAEVAPHLTRALLPRLTLRRVGGGGRGRGTRGSGEDDGEIGVGDIF